MRRLQLHCNRVLQMDRNVADHHSMSTFTSKYSFLTPTIELCIICATLTERSATLRKQSIINLDRRTAKTKRPLIKVVISSGTYSIHCGGIH
ncbi:Uncharacterized protein LW94_7531 [Fusarium fujikuroi]|nr:Uncharacterized protein LW93_9089 [Fusarium fujikuroi]KLP09326.1 Uncharacterized protein Y057_10432 [Fusarium fujikuroi]KLP13173.1 Uncharacterized protein LW94_7531 [Fusarium fujikuroi]